MTAFVDTNIVVYAFGREDSKIAVAERILQEKPTISTQVVGEFLSVCRTKLGLDRTTRHRLASELMTGCRLVAVNAAVVAKAMDVEAQSGLSYWDALIVAAALLSGCDTLYSEDMQHGQIIERLTVIDPFLELKP